MNTNRSTICVHEHAAERNANVCLTVLHVSKGKWERKIMNKENMIIWIAYMLISIYKRKELIT